jgi:hypothetical protein
MNDHAVPGTANEPATRPGEGYFDSPAPMKGRRAKPRRFFSKSRLTAVAATAALGVAIGGTAAHAATPFLTGRPSSWARIRSLAAHRNTPAGVTCCRWITAPWVTLLPSS